MEGRSEEGGGEGYDAGMFPTSVYCKQSKTGGGWSLGTSLEMMCTSFGGGDGDDLASQTLAVFLLHVDNGNDCEIKKVWLAKMQEGGHVSLMNPLLISSINWYLI